jgi:tRNA(Met) cytidine acetyltransferase
MYPINPKEAIKKVLSEAERSGERRVLVIKGHEFNSIKDVVEELSRDKSVLCVGLPETGNARTISYEETDSVLGSTFDALFADLSDELRPNDLGILVETVRGGGIIVFLVPDDWLSRLTRFQRELISPPYTERDVRQAFKRRFLESLGSEGVWLLDGEKLMGVERSVEKKKTEKPQSDDPVESLSMSEDQLNVIRTILSSAASPKKQIIAITANRGRGKSAALGLAASLILGRRISRSIGVTASSPDGVQIFFSFLKKGLEAQGMKYNEVKRDGKTVAVISGRRMVFYRSPISMSELDIRIKIVDEAATVPVHLLFRIARKSRLSVFATTVHGYEGSGRGFTMKFLKAMESKNTRFLRLEMRTPIRYPEGDPVELWLYRLLLLDAEPASVKEDEIRYEKLDPEKLDEEKLREFYGIYVLAHYRNRPDDLAMMLDAPHHHMRAVLMGDNVVAAAQICEEGRLNKSMIDAIMERKDSPPGHMIPSRILVHYGNKEFCKLWGWRIVRIAVHPELQGRGIGSRMLSFIHEEAEDAGVDWIGAGFGASPELLKFWLKNGFLPVHMSPQRSDVSGEYSVFVIKPVSEKARRSIEELNAEFKRRILSTLHDVYFDADPEVIRLVLSAGTHEERPRLRFSQILRLRDYIREFNTYEMASDAIKELLTSYFMSRAGSLPEDAERILIAKNLQGRPWPLIVRIARKKTMKETIDKVRECVRSLYELYSDVLPRLE